ncbi:MAG: enoyl-CoA hydratase/isomerase family protein [Pseudomonadota bacterium]
MTTSDALQQVGEFVSLRRRGRIATVTLDRGDGLNALSIQAMTELKTAAAHLHEDTQTSVVVLNGEAVFSAGADLKDNARLSRADHSLLEQRQAMRLGPDLCQAWADLEQITIVAIEGFCIGGGLALAVSCDHRIAAEDAHFRLPEVPLGMNMSWRSVPRLVALLGPSRAKRVIALGQKITARQAHDWSLVDEVTPPGGAVDAALKLAADYAALPPLALRMTKQAVDVAAQPLAHATSFMDRDQFMLAASSEDQREAIAAFLEKRTPNFKGN